MSFYVYLSSNSPNNTHQHTNSLFHFITQLSRPLELEGNWEVALVEITYPKFTKSDNLFFFIYTDIVEYTFVGSKQYPIIRPLLLKNTESNFTVNLDNFVNPYYIPLNKSKIKSIEIQIETDLVVDKDSFSLQSGDIYLVLHLRKRK